MDISFSKPRMSRELSCDAELQRKYGNQAKVIRRRLDSLCAADHLGEFTPYERPERCHELKGERRGTFTMDLIPPFRLCFKPTDEVFYGLEGGMDWKQVTAIVIIGVEDTH
ncbi:MAG: killer suppression protein [Magnetococcales bacterium]|nr:killer suppression protein [Magnetococcales bacterium]